MKPMLIFTGLLFAMLNLGACGKKAEVKDSSSPDKAIPKSEVEKYFGVLKEVEEAINSNNVEALEKTLNSNLAFDLDQYQTDGNTFLITAINKDFSDIRNLLLERGASPSKANINKVTPLMAAVEKGNLFCVQALLNLEIDLDKKNSEGNTALHLALQNNLEDIAIALIKQGANLETNNKDNKNAYRLAEESQCKKAFDLIRGIMQVEFGTPDLATYRSLITVHDNNRLRQVLGRFPKIVNDYEAINPLALLVDSKNQPSALETASILLENKANVNGPLNAEVTPLIKATTSLNKGFAHLFLDARANPQLLDKEGKSALIHAVELNDFDLVDLLLSYSAVEKYTFRKNDKKITYNACSIAKDAAKKLNGEDKAINKQIQKRLDCGLLSWLF